MSRDTYIAISQPSGLQKARIPDVNYPWRVILLWK